MPKRRVLCPMTLALLVILSIAGCSSSDDRLVDLSQESAQRQAEQNQAIAKQSQEIAQTAHKLVEADGQARREVIQLQTDLQKDAQADRRNLDRQHEDLEGERRQLAQQRHRDPIIAAAIVNAGLLLACLSPLVLAWFVLRAVQREPADAALGELLVQELVADEPLLLASNFAHPQMLEHQAGPLVPEPPAADQAA